MARQVARHSRSVKTVYVDVSGFDRWGFENVFLDNIIHAIQERFPSFYDERDCNVWPEKEVRRIAGNGHAIVTVSEYMGLAAICLVPRKHRGGNWFVMGDRTGLAYAWCSQVADSFRDSIPYPVYRNVATASNGEAAYRLIGS